MAVGEPRYCAYRLHLLVHLPDGLLLLPVPLEGHPQGRQLFPEHEAVVLRTRTLNTAAGQEDFVRPLLVKF